MEKINRQRMQELEAQRLAELSPAERAEHNAITDQLAAGCVQEQRERATRRGSRFYLLDRSAEHAADWICEDPGEGITPGKPVNAADLGLGFNGSARFAALRLEAFEKYRNERKHYCEIPADTWAQLEAMDPPDHVVSLFLERSDKWARVLPWDAPRDCGGLHVPIEFGNDYSERVGRAMFGTFAGIDATQASRALADAQDIARALRPGESVRWQWNATKREGATDPDSIQGVRAADVNDYSEVQGRWSGAGIVRPELSLRVTRDLDPRETAKPGTIYQCTAEKCKAARAEAIATGRPVVTAVQTQHREMLSTMRREFPGLARFVAGFDPASPDRPDHTAISLFPVKRRERVSGFEDTHNPYPEPGAVSPDRPGHTAELAPLDKAVAMVKQWNARRKP